MLNLGKQIQNWMEGDSPREKTLEKIEEINDRIADVEQRIENVEDFMSVDKHPTDTEKLERLREELKTLRNKKAELEEGLGRYVENN